MSAKLFLRCFLFTTVYGVFCFPFLKKIKARNTCVCPVQMGIASVVHLYVFPAKPYGLMGDRFTGSVSVLGDYASVDCPIDPDEIRDSERPTKVRLPQPDVDIRSGMTLKESMRDVFVGGGEYVSLLFVPSKEMII